MSGRTTCAEGFNITLSNELIHYRVLKDEYDLILIVDGTRRCIDGYYIGSITQADPDSGISSVLEWRDKAVSSKALKDLSVAMDGELHELPLLMGHVSDVIVDTVKMRLDGFYPETDFFGLVIQYIDENFIAYSDESYESFDDPMNLSKLFWNITGHSIEYAVEDDSLLREYF